MSGDVIKSFLVSLGFDIDESSLKKFNKAISNASLRVTALYTSVKIAAAGIVYGISKISEGFENLGYDLKLIAPAINKALILKQEVFKAYRAAGVDLVKIIQNSVKLNLSLAKTRIAFEALYRSTASRFFGILTKQSDAFRQKLYANMPKIQSALERFVQFIFKAFEATTTLGLRVWSILTRVYEFFADLDKATDGWSTKILGFAAAWKLLNLSFLATPIGALIAGLTAILALYDDYKTFMEGGNSLFDWSYAIPVIETITKWVGILAAELGEVFQIIFAIGDALTNLVQGKLFNFGEAVQRGFESLGNLLGGAGAPAMAAFQGLTNMVSPALSSAPLGSQPSGSQVNQSVQQKTDINIMGSPDAAAVGKAVSSEQYNVNRDLTRNLKGAVRPR